MLTVFVMVAMKYLAGHEEIIEMESGTDNLNDIDSTLTLDQSYKTLVILLINFVGHTTSDNCF